MGVDQAEQVGLPVPGRHGQARRGDLVADPHAGVPGEQQVGQRVDDEVVVGEHRRDQAGAARQLVDPDPGDQRVGQPVGVQVLQVRPDGAPQGVAEAQVRGRAVGDDVLDGLGAHVVAGQHLAQQVGDQVDEDIDKEGTITAGSASQISDGACAVVVMSKAKAEELGLTWLAEIGASGQVAGPDSTLQMQPANAIAKACAKEGIAVADLDLVEINEAFAAVGIVSARELGIDDDKVNVNGGAIALGHPVGMSGARIALHLALELKRRGGGTGAAALCGGGGQGDALILHVPA